MDAWKTPTGSRHDRRPPAGCHLLLLSAFRVRCLGMFVCVLRVLLSLCCVLFALGMIVLPMRISGCAMRLCCGFMLFRRLVVCVFHFGYSCWPENLGGL